MATVLITQCLQRDAAGRARGDALAGEVAGSTIAVRSAIRVSGEVRQKVIVKR
jgi:hypothetical protein